MEIAILSLGAFLFIAVHLVPAIGNLREQFVQQITEGGYKALFSIFSFAGLLFMVWGMVRAPHIDIWLPPAWARSAALLIMAPALILLAAAKFPTNIKRFTPHPMMWGFILWSGAHLLANGDLASIILFGSIGAYSIVAIVSANSRGAKVSTTTVPIGKEAVVIGFGVVVYTALLFLHPYLFGAAVL